MVLVAYPLGGLLALAVVLPFPATAAGVLLPAWLVVLAGVHHLDGVADCGDAAAAHGSPADRRAILSDTSVGVGGTTAVGLIVVALALAGIALSGLPATTALAIVLAAEVGAKLGMVAIAGVGTATHEGMGSTLSEDTTVRELALGVVFAIPAIALAVAWRSPAAVLAIVATLAATAGVLWWARRNLGGISGDVFGAGNELARVAGLHAGVIVWTAL